MFDLTVLESDDSAMNQLKKFLTDEDYALNTISSVSTNSLTSVLVVSEEKFKEIETALGSINAVAVISQDSAIEATFAKFDVYTLELNKEKDVTVSKLKLLNRIVELKNDLEKLSTTDPLTGLYNRKYLHQRLEEEISRAKRYSTPLSIILFDIDYFKSVNDIFGYQFGDDVLIQLGAIMEKYIRKEDIITRYGDEEFVIALPNTDNDSAYKLADRMRESIGKMDFNKDLDDPDPLAIRLSGGLYTFTGENPDDSVDDIVRYAEHALYNAKKTGKNKIIDFNRLEFKI